VSAGQIPFLRQPSPEDADALLKLVRRRQIKQGTEILRAGSAGDEAVLVLRGRVRLVAFGAERREVVLALRGPGELIGEMAAMGAGRRTASGIAVDDVEVGLLPARELADFLRGHPDAAIVMIRMLVRRLTEATCDVVDLATQDSVGRLAKRSRSSSDLMASPDLPSGMGSSIWTRLRVSSTSPPISVRRRNTLTDVKPEAGADRQTIRPRLGSQGADGIERRVQALNR